MIQRIQSLYLFLAGLFYSFMLLFPFFTRYDVEAGSSVKLYVHQLVLRSGDITTSEWQLITLILAILLIGGAWATIFFFKNRMLQYKLTRFFLLLGTGLIVALLFTWDNVSETYSELPGSSFSWAAGLPLITLLLFYLANKAILRDEKSIRSASRLR